MPSRTAFVDLPVIRNSHLLSVPISSNSSCSGRQGRPRCQRGRRQPRDEAMAWRGEWHRRIRIYKGSPSLHPSLLGIPLAGRRKGSTWQAAGSARATLMSAVSIPAEVQRMTITSSSRVMSLSCENSIPTPTFTEVVRKSAWSTVATCSKHSFHVQLPRATRRAPRAAT